MKLEFPMFQLVSIACCPLTTPLRRVQLCLLHTLLLPSFRQPSQVWANPKPLLVHHVLQPPTPPLGSLQYASFSPILGHPKLDTLLLMWSHRGWLWGSYHLPQLDGLTNAAQYVTGLFCCMGSLVTWFLSPSEANAPTAHTAQIQTYLFQVESSGVLSDPMCIVKGGQSREGKGIFSQDSQTSRLQPPNIWDDQILN